MDTSNMRPGQIFRTLAAVAMTAMSMGLTSPGAPNALAAPAAPAASSDSYLSNLSFDQGTLTPAFISTTQEYTLTAPYVPSVVVSYTTNSPLASGISYHCYGTPETCSLKDSNTGQYVFGVNAEDSSRRYYTVTYQRADGVMADPMIAPVVKLSQSATAEHKCAVLRNGKLLCWGENKYGQLGLGTTSSEEYLPLTVTGVTDAVDVAVGLDHTCILRTGGAVQCWGANDKGQLGDGTTTNRTTPVDVLNLAGTGPLTGVTSISLGAGFTCAVVNSTALCWGLDFVLSDYTNTYSHTLPLAVSGVSGVADVAVGEGFACVLTNAGKVQCWGNGNSNGKMGIGTTSLDPISVPVTMKDPSGTADLIGATALRAGQDYTCVIAASGYQLCTGSNSYYTMSDGDPATSRTLLVTMTVTGTAQALANVVQSAPGMFHKCVLVAGGTVHCSGSGYNGSVGIGLDYPLAESSRAVTVTTSLGGPPLSGVVEVATSGSDSTCARTDTGVYCWGRLVGNGLFSPMFSPHLSIVIPPASSDDASLAALTLDAPAVLQGTWVSSTTRYTVNVSAGETGVMFALTPSVTSTLNINGDSSAGGCDVSYSQGEEGGNGGCTIDPSGTTWITLTVTAEDGTTLDYVIVVNPPVASSDDASLAALTPDAPAVLQGTWVSSTTRYTVNVPAGETGVMFALTPSVTSTLNINGDSSAGGCDVSYSQGEEAGNGGCTIDPSGTTWITLTVTAEDGTTTLDYVIVVNPPVVSSDATLSALAIVPGTLSPAFVSSTTSYTAQVPAGTTSVAVTATVNQVSATVAYTSSAGACTAGTCTVAAPKTWITVTVTAEDGTTTEEYVIEITVAASLTTIDRVWPGTGLPEGGMPVQIFGMGFVAALTVTVGPYTDGLMIDVPFVSVNDGQIDFVMPAGVAGQRVSVTVQTANDTQTASNAFTYVQPEMIEFDGETGGVFTTTDGVVVTIPPQGIAGTFFLTMTPLPPAPGVPGNVLMYSFRLDAVLNGFKLETLTNPVTITLPIDEGIFAIADGERPWLYQWVGGSDSNRYRDSGRLATKTNTMTIHSAAAGSWSLVRGQEYNPGTRLMTVALRPMGVYALSTAYVREYWFPVVPVVK